ncbi:MAG: flagellar protein FliT [Sandaracinus sp.]|nr:flagellar protein FliT [Sandaracinus sp.]MCB9632496.1 flagellar protein FliT [Sandaracinus sp.]
MSTPQRWSALLDALEACWCDPTVAEPEEVLRVLEERQHLLDELRALDGSALDEASRAALRARMTLLVERDTSLVAATTRWRDELQAQATRIRDGRVAAAGYARDLASDGTHLIRKA